MSRIKGKVKWFNDAKGYGFIEHSNGKDIFVHYSSIKGDGYKSLEEGDDVEFELQDGPKGPQAHEVVKVGHGSSGGKSGGRSDDGDDSHDAENG